MQRLNLRFIHFSLAVAALAATAAAAPQMRLGDQSRWSLGFRVRIEQAAGLPTEIHLSGDWILTFVAIRPGDYDAQLQIANLRFIGDQNRSAPAALDHLRRSLQRPFWATYRENGELLAMHFYKDVKPSERNLLQMIATETQTVRPETARAVWTAMEHDGAGAYLAMYQHLDANTLIKHKLKYIYTDGVAGAPAESLGLSIDQSDIRFSLDEAGRVRQLDGDNRVRMEVPLGDEKSLSAISAIHLSGLATPKADDLAGSLERARPEVATYTIITHRQDPSAILAKRDERLLKGHSTAELLEAAMTLHVQDSELPERLAALFRRRLESVQSALTLLRNKGPQRRITTGLGVAATPVTVEALDSLARERTSPVGLRIDALNAYVQMQHPSLDAMRVPLALIDDPDSGVSSAARVIAGALARAGRADHRQEAEQLDFALITRYRSADDVPTRCNLLAALGNSVGPEVLPVIKEALRDSHETVRATAARALRLVPGEVIDGLLSGVISTDSAAKVRAEALYALNFRPSLTSQLGEAMVHAATADGVEYVRSNAITALRQHPMASPRTVEVLRKIAEEDVSSAIRRQAQAALDTIRP